MCWSRRKTVVLSLVLLQTQKDFCFHQLIGPFVHSETCSSFRHFVYTLHSIVVNPLPDTNVNPNMFITLNLLIYPTIL